jgi:serologically defined colon cancer antigen 8
LCIPVWLVEFFLSLQAELEVRRLKDELDRQHEKMRELLQEQGRKVQDERMQLERRYTQQMEQLSTDLTSHWDSSSKLQLELEKQRRVEVDLRRDLQQKALAVEELKKELQSKIGELL